MFDSHNLQFWEKKYQQIYLWDCEIHQKLNRWINKIGELQFVHENMRKKICIFINKYFTNNFPVVNKAHWVLQNKVHFWNNIRVRKWWQNFHFWMNSHFKCTSNYCPLILLVKLCLGLRPFFISLDLLCSPGLQSVSREQMESRTFEMVRAGLQLSFRMSRQITPWLLMLQW